MNNNSVIPKLWVFLTVPIVILLALASGAGVFVDGLYRDVPYFAAQARGQDYVSLFIVVPTLIIAAWFAVHHSVRALLIWIGVLVYLVYSYAIAAFAVKYNPMFLIYVSLFGFSLYALIGALGTIRLEAIKANFTARAPTKTVSIYLAVLMMLFYALWLSENIPALITGTIPQSIIDNGTPTNVVHVLDMAWMLPACGIAAISLWRKKPLGYTIAGCILSYCVLLILAILGMAISMIQSGHPLVIPQIVIFAVMFIVNLGILILYMKSLRPLPNEE